MRATAIIIKNGQILLIHRFHKGEYYYVFPGGGVEKNESLEAAAIREIKEETNLNAKLNKKLWEYENGFDGRTHHYFLVTEFNGDLKLGGPEAEKNFGPNRYILEWHNLNNLGDMLVYPEQIKEKVIKEFSR